MKTTIKNLNRIKLNNRYTFEIGYNLGFGSGSQGTYTLSGQVKEITLDFIRVIPDKNLAAGNRRSEKVDTRSIVNVF